MVIFLLSSHFLISLCPFTMHIFDILCIFLLIGVRKIQRSWKSAASKIALVKLRFIDFLNEMVIYRYFLYFCIQIWRGRSRSILCPMDITGSNTFREVLWFLWSVQTLSLQEARHHWITGMINLRRLQTNCCCCKQRCFQQLRLSLCFKDFISKYFLLWFLQAPLFY